MIRIFRKRDVVEAYKYPPQDNNVVWVNTEDSKLYYFLNGEWVELCVPPKAVTYITIDALSDLDDVTEVGEYAVIWTHDDSSGTVSEVLTLGVSRQDYPTSSEYGTTQVLQSIGGVEIKTRYKEDGASWGNWVTASLATEFDLDDLEDDIDEKLATKANLSGATFTGDVVIGSTSAPKDLEVKGVTTCNQLKVTTVEHSITTLTQNADGKFDLKDVSDGETYHLISDITSTFSWNASMFVDSVQSREISLSYHGGTIPALYNEAIITVHIVSGSLYLTLDGIFGDK